jgi:hypothetical protein
VVLSNVAISARGPRNVLVLDRNCVPIADVCDQLCIGGDHRLIQRRFAITMDEVYACAEAWTDVRKITEDDFISLSVYENNGEFDVQTTGISDWIFLSLLSLGRLSHPEVDNPATQHAYGLESIITDCCFDIIAGEDHYKMCELHDCVFTEFEKKFHKVDANLARQILNWLKIDEDTINELTK